MVTNVGSRRIFYSYDGDREHVLMSACGTSLSPSPQLRRYLHAQDCGLAQQCVACRGIGVGTWNAHAMGGGDIARFVLQLRLTVWFRQKGKVPMSAGFTLPSGPKYQSVGIDTCESNTPRHDELRHCAWERE